MCGHELAFGYLAAGRERLCVGDGVVLKRPCHACPEHVASDALKVAAGV